MVWACWSLDSLCKSFRYFIAWSPRHWNLSRIWENALSCDSWNHRPIHSRAERRGRRCGAGIGFGTSKRPCERLLSHIFFNYLTVLQIQDDKREGYTEISASILDGWSSYFSTNVLWLILNRKVLRIQDPTGKLLAELFTLPPELRQKLKDAIALVQAAMPGEWRDDTSRRELYSYLSCHYSWYARFGEKVR